MPTADPPLAATQAVRRRKVKEQALGEKRKHNRLLPQAPGVVMAAPGGGAGRAEQGSGVTGRHRAAASCQKPPGVA